MPKRCLIVVLRESALIAALLRGGGARLLLTCGLAGVVGAGSTVTALAGGNCAGTSRGRIPLTDLGTGLYQGFEGGLYPGGVNVRPSAHDNDADRKNDPDLRLSRDLQDAICAVSTLPSPAMTLPAIDPPPGEAVYCIDSNSPCR